MFKDQKSLLIQLGLAVFAWALPSSHVLANLINHFRKGLLATIIAGVLTSSILLFSVFALYKMLLSYGVDEWASLGITFLALTLLSLISGYIAKRHFVKTATKTKNMSLFNSELNQQPSLESLIASFADGFMEEEICKQAKSDYAQKFHEEPDRNLTSDS